MALKENPLVCCGTTCRLGKKTNGYDNDSPQLNSLIKQTPKCFSISEVYTDMQYSSKQNLELVGVIGGTLYILFKKNVTVKSRGPTTWSKMYHYFQFNRDEFMKHYHKRSNIESTNAAIKRRFG
ncbi:hypothetical protein [Methanosarcina sp. UBA289]|uniref:hypothetical protein n=1 Tax=Methanosarcina sp. UBA289 TaxID=1915574 RepID=UPI0025CC07E4|nr:hypothetical protein [Methanosarcina sp. UBA289]